MERPKPWDLFNELRLAQDVENKQSRKARLKFLLESLSDEALHEYETLLIKQRLVLLATVVTRQRIFETVKHHDTVLDQLGDAEWDFKEEAQRVAELLYLVHEAKLNLFRENEAMLATPYDDGVQALDDFAPPPPTNDEE